MTTVAFNSANTPTLLDIWCSVRWSDDIGRRQYKYSEDATQSSLNIIIYQVRRVRCCVTADWQSTHDCIVLYCIRFDSIRSQLNSTQLILVSCVMYSEWWWGMMSLTQIRIQSLHGVSHWLIVGVQCWLCSFFLSVSLACLRSVAYYIVSRDRLVLVFATRIL